MANKTVYPYGKNGTLPSGYPIADDLKTNSAQQALSAKQGKIIGDYLLPEILTPIDLDLYITRNFSLAATGWTSVTGKHKAIPVTPGTTLRLSLSTTGNFYGFFTSYTAPSAATSSTPYVSGTSRVWIAVGEHTVVVPDTAAYLIICTVDGSGQSTTWTVSKVNTYRDRTIADDYLREDSVVDDMVTGGNDVPLSAHQGKIIGDYLFNDYVPVDLAQVTVSDYSLGANSTTNDKWTNATAKHQVISVVPGERIKMVVGVASNFFGFLASYTVPTSGSSAVNYAPNTGRITAQIGTTEVVVPTGANYLCITKVNGSGYVSTWELHRGRTPGIEEDFIKANSRIVNVGIDTDVDVASVTESERSLGVVGGRGVWIPGLSNSARHKVIGVTPGETIYVRATNSSNEGNFRGWLTSSYVVPTSQSEVPYVNGTSRVWQEDSSGWVEMQVPLSAAYLCLVTVNGDRDSTIWLVKKKVFIPVSEAVEDFTLKETDIVDNLEDGGHKAPLSAEQGKVLRGLVTDGIPTGLTKHEYVGESIRVNNKHSVASNKVATITSIACQGGACFGDYLFMFKEENTTCWIYNLSTNTLLQTITIPSEQRGFVSDCHCNTVNFGTEYYDANDPFPLIYVSTGYNDGTDSGALVYRIVATTENDVTTYSLTLVQTLKLPGTSWTEFVVGEDGFCYLCYTNYRKIYRMKMPTLSQGNITFDLEQALDVYQFTPQPAWYKGSRNQNRIYHEGRIYLVSGVPASNETSLFVALDLATGRRVAEIDLYNTLGLTSEPEALFIWRGQFCIAFRSNANVYALFFE